MLHEKPHTRDVSLASLLLHQCPESLPLSLWVSGPSPGARGAAGWPTGSAGSAAPLRRGVGVRSQAGPWCQAGTPRHPLHGGGGRRKDAGPAGRCAPPERLDDAGEPGQLAFFYPLFGVSVQYLKVCSGVGASYWLIQVCDFSPLGYIKVCNQVGGTWRSFYWVNERRRG